MPLRNLELRQNRCSKCHILPGATDVLISIPFASGRSLWSKGLKRGSAADRLLGLRVSIAPQAWMSVSCGCCVLSGGGLYDGPISRPEESYQPWCVTVYYLGTSEIRLPWPGLDCCSRGGKGNYSHLMGGKIIVVVINTRT